MFHYIAYHFHLKVRFVKVGTLVGGQEVTVGGNVQQADTMGIKAVWDGRDSQSGILRYEVAIGTVPGILTDNI